MPRSLKRFLTILAWIGAIAGGILAATALLAKEHRKVT